MNGFLSKVNKDDIARYESELLREMKMKHGDVLDKIREEGVISDDLKGRLDGILAKFTEVFA